MHQPDLSIRGPRYANAPVQASVAAILSSDGFVTSTAGREGQLLGLVLDRTCFYAEQGAKSLLLLIINYYIPHSHILT